MIINEGGDCMRLISWGRCLVRRRVSRLGLGAQFGHGKPIVLVRLVGDPRWQRHAKIAAQRLGVTLVKHTHVAKPLDGVTVAANTYTALAEQVIKPLVALGGEPVGSIAYGSQGEDLGEIDECVPRHGKG